MTAADVQALRDEVSRHLQVSGDAIQALREEVSGLKLHVKELSDEIDDFRELCNTNGIQYDEWLAERRHSRFVAQMRADHPIEGGATAPDSCAVGAGFNAARNGRKDDAPGDTPIVPSVPTVPPSGRSGRPWPKASEQVPGTSELTESSTTGPKVEKNELKEAREVPMFQYVNRQVWS